LNRSEWGYESADIRLTSVNISTLDISNPMNEKPFVNVSNGNSGNLTVNEFWTNQSVDILDDSDILFYRMGFYRYHQLNTELMVLRYDYDKWDTVDIKIDWGDNDPEK